MPDFSELFLKTDVRPVYYKGQAFFLADKFPVTNGDTLIINIESTKSDHLQGLYIDVTGWVKSRGRIFKKRNGVKLLYWEDTAPKNIHLQVFTKKEFVWVANIWKSENKPIDYGHLGAAMIVEEIPNGRRYRCNDWRPDEDFDDIIFTIERQVDPLPEGT